MAHLEDYTVQKQPITPVLTYHCRGPHRRLLLRISWRCAEDKYIPMTFLCDTGAPLGIYLSERAVELLVDEDLLHEGDTGIVHVMLGADQECFPAQVQDTPLNYGQSNLIGLPVLMKLGLTLSPDGFAFKKQLNHF